LRLLPEWCEEPLPFLLLPIYSGKEGRRREQTAESSKRCENTGEARTLFIEEEEEGNRSPPTTVTE
jgi:hypothetical protein